MIVSLRQSLLLGFGLVLALFVGTILFINYEVTAIQNTQSRLIDTRIPTILAGEKLLDGVDLSLAGLRGYMILGTDSTKGDSFKAERAAGWVKIDAVLADYEQLSANWTESANVEHLQNMKISVEAFRIAQQQVEDIAHEPSNVPAMNILFTEAAPLAKKVSSAIKAMINEEATLAATTDRKNLLISFEESLGSYEGSLASIRAYLLSGDDAYREEFLNKWALNDKHFKAIGTQESLLTSTQKAQWTIYTQSRALFEPLPQKMFQLRSQKEWNTANHWLATKAAPRAGEIKALLAKLADSQITLKIKDIEELHGDQNKLATIGSSIAIISIILGIFIAFFLSSTLSKQLQRMVDAAKNLSNGDLTFSDVKMGSLKEFNTLAHSFNVTKLNLNNLVSRILDASNNLSSHTKDLESLIDNAYKISTKQQKDTDVIVISMTEMSKTVEEVSRNTTEAASSAEDADTSTATGHEIVTQTVTSINELAVAIENASTTINQLGEETNAVDTILSSISGIADQTNLLALNAAIEAARAGEQGRGFAVVADEVRSLASRTQESTVEIRTMLDRLKSGANNAVEVMSAGHQQAQASVEKANIASETLDNIAKEMKIIKDMNTQIASLAKQQSAVTADMSSNVNIINDGADEVSNASKDSLTSIHQIAALMSDLEKGVSEFKIDKARL